jgi:uncharacterized membrane protein YbaN (DUF454 family)
MRQEKEAETNEKHAGISNPVLRIIVLACGWFFVFLAMLGALLPLIPTTPFLLIAAACFYRSSGKFYRWIMNNRYFGHYLQDYKAGMGIPLRIKITTLSFTWLSTILSSIFFIPWLWLKILVVLISAAVTVHLLMIKTRK